MYLIAFQGLARKRFLLFLNHNILELKQTLYLVYFFYFVDMEIEG